MKVKISQNEFNELIREIEDMLINEDIDIDNSPQFKQALIKIMNHYIYQALLQVEKENNKYYNVQSNKAIKNAEYNINIKFSNQSKSIDKLANNVKSKVNKNSKIYNRITDDQISLNNLSNKINSAEKLAKKLNWLLNKLKSTFALIAFSSVITGIIMGLTIYILSKTT